jgi:hypothetical protein
MFQTSGGNNFRFFPHFGRGQLFSFYSVVDLESAIYALVYTKIGKVKRGIKEDHPAEMLDRKAVGLPGHLLQIIFRHGRKQSQVIPLIEAIFCNGPFDIDINNLCKKSLKIERTITL